MKPVSLALVLACASLYGQVKITPGPEKVTVEIDGKPFTEFVVAGPTVTKPYLHPLRAASGTYVTRLWPMENPGGEPTDHKHQRGLWIAHDDVNKTDFWNNEADYTKPPRRGKIVLKKLGKVTSGKDKGTIQATFDWVDADGKTILTEDRTMTFYDDPQLRIIDFDFTLKALDKVTFGDGKDGFFALRIRPDLQEQKGNGHLVNADGLETEKALWGKPSNWVDYYGEVKGEKLGIAILDHPGNPRHPVRWHARGYGLFAANPFGLAVFTNDKSQDGSLTLDQGKSLHFRYRVVVHPADAKSARIADMYTKYASSK